MGKRGKTTTRHKEDNTFRFERFEDKLKKISTDVRLDIRDGRNTELGEGETFLFQCVEKWGDLNRTESFGVLTKDIGEDIKTLPQILNHKDKILNLLLSHISDPLNKASYEPAFGLIVAVSRDLESEFYSYFPSFFNQIIRIATTSSKEETHLIEHGFKCYAYLIKYLRIQIKRDLKGHLKLFAPLLDPQNKKYVVDFACEAFSVVGGALGKTNPQSFLTSIFEGLLRDHPERSIGVGILLFSIFKSVSNCIANHEQWPNLSKCIQFIESLESEDQSVWLSTLKTLMERILDYVKPDKKQLHWEILEAMLSENVDYKDHLFDLYAHMIEYNGERMALIETKPRILILEKLTNNVDFSLYTQTILRLYEIGFLRKVELTNQLHELILKIIEETTEFSLLRSIDLTIKKNDIKKYFGLYLSPLISAYNRIGLPFSTENKNVDTKVHWFIESVAETILLKNGFYLASEKYNTTSFSGFYQPFYFLSSQKEIISTVDLSYVLPDLRICCSSIAVHSSVVDFTDDKNVENLLKAILVASRVRDKFCQNCHNKCNLILVDVIKHLKTTLSHSNSDSSTSPIMLLYYILEYFMVHSPSKPIKLEEIVDVLFTVERKEFLDSTTLWMLKCLDLIVHILKKRNGSEVKHLYESRVSNFEEMSDYLASGFPIVRALALSVLIAVDKVEHENQDQKLLAMYEAFLELENMTQCNPEFSPKMKKTLTECQVIINSEETSEKCKQIVLKYTLGQMYRNYSETWPLCVKVINTAGQTFKSNAFWALFGKVFQNHYDANSKIQQCLDFVNTPDQLLLDFEKVNITKALNNVNFCPPQREESVSEKLDVLEYKNNLWKCLKGVNLQKETTSYVISKITEILEAFISERRRGNLKQQIKLLGPVFEFLEKCSRVGGDSLIWQKGVDMLTVAPKRIRTSIWKFVASKRTKDLKNYTEFIDELIEKDSLDVLLSIRSDAVDTTLDQRFANETSSRRDFVMSIVLRILIGKERELKPKQRKVILRFVAACSAFEAETYIKLCEFTSKESRSPKVAEMKINKIKNILTVWEYSFPNLLFRLLDQMCELSRSVVSMNFKQFRQANEDLTLSNESDEADSNSCNVETYTGTNEVPESVFEEWKIRALKAARSCLVLFYEKFHRLNLPKSTVDKIFDLFIWPATSDLTLSLNSNISWILNLFNIWSLQEKYHPLLAKACNNDVRTSPMEGLCNLLASEGTKDQVKDYVMNIFLNLGKTNEDDETKPVELEPMEVEEAEDDIIFSDVFNPSLRVGLNILLYRKTVILDLLKETKFLKKLLNGVTGEQWLHLISQIVEYVDDEPSKESLCSIMMDTLILSKNKEENLLHALTACKSLLNNLKNHSALLLKLGYCFTWIKERRPRTALCSILESCEDEFLYADMAKVNAWVANQASDVPNYTERHQGYISLEKRIRQSFEVVLYTMAAYQCFHDILHESDLGTRTSAVNLLTAIAESVNTFGNEDEKTKLDIRKFLDAVIIPRLKGGIRHQDDSKFADFLKVLLSFVINSKSVHGTFKELYTIFKIGKDDPEILTRLPDIKVNMKTRALNSLCKRVEEDGTNISASTLVAFILPLAHHFLFVEKSDSKSQFNELVDAAISVKRAVLGILPHDQYFKILQELVMQPEKSKLVAKRYERVLISTLDAFHFDLSLGVIVNQNKTIPELAKTGEFIDTDEMIVDEDTKPNSNLEVTGLVVIAKAAARKYLQLLKQKIIPKLRRYLKFDEKATHKLSRADKSVKDEVRLKIPCTLALVQLLKKLPANVSNDGIGSIIPSLCNKMGDKDIRIRNEMRQTIVSVVKELGTSQLSRVISYLRASLQRGYKKHVLNYTVKHLLVGLEKELKDNPSHVPVKSIIPICEDELFGIMEEEKDVQKIIQKTAEASRSNAHLLIKMCAKNIQIDNYYVLIEPAIRQSEQKKKEKIVKICRKWLASVSEGLSDNPDVNPVSFLKWLHELLLKDTLDKKSTKDATVKNPRKLLTDTKDHKLITVVKRQGQGKIGGERKTTKSFLTEFAFTCLYNALKKSSQVQEALTISDNVKLLDPFVEHLAKEIKSPSKDIGIVALRCSTLIFQFDLDSFQSQKYLDMFWTGGVLAIDTHHEMFNATFKFLHAFLVRFPSYNISKQDLTLIFGCIQKQLHNDTCSASALTMLKEILQIKLNHNLIKSLLKDVFEKSITSPYLHINEGCRMAYLMYFSNYLDASKEQQLTEEIGMITRQLSYRIEQGRLSAVATLTSVISILPEGSFNTLKEFIFMEMLLALGNEQSAAVKEKLYEGIQLLFKTEKEKSLMSLLIALFSDKDRMPNYDTFFLVAGCVIHDVTLCDNSHFKQLLFIIETTLSEDTEKEWPEIPDMTQQIRDSTIFQCLNTLKKCLLRKVDGLPLWSKSVKYCDNMQNVFKYLREMYLYYEHEWIPLTVVRICDLLLTNINLAILKSINQLGVFVSQEDELLELIKRLWNLHCHTKNEELDKETIEVMFKLIRVTVSLKTSTVLEKLVVHFYRGVQVEVVKQAKEFSVRRTAYQCFCEVASHCPEDAIELVAEKMIRIAVRDLTDDNVPSDVKSLGEQLTSALRNRLGNDRFNFIYADLSDKLHTKRHENKAKKKEVAVKYPELQRKRTKKPPNFNGAIKKRKKFEVI